MRRNDRSAANVSIPALAVQMTAGATYVTICPLGGGEQYGALLVRKHLGVAVRRRLSHLRIQRLPVLPERGADIFAQKRAVPCRTGWLYARRSAG